MIVGARARPKTAVANGSSGAPVRQATLAPLAFAQESPLISSFTAPQKPLLAYEALAIGNSFARARPWKVDRDRAGRRLASSRGRFAVPAQKIR